MERNIPRIFLVLALLLGAVFAFLNPPLQAPDEFAHFFRAYGVSQGQFVAHDLTRVPAGVVDLTREFPIHLEKAHRVRTGEIIDDLGKPLQESQSRDVPNEAIGLYSFLPYLASGGAIRLGRWFSASPLALLYLGRLANGIAYALVVYFALRLLPDFHALLFCLALAPTALYQANSLSIDAITFSVAFLLCAYLLHLAFDPAIGRIGNAQYAATAVLTALAALCKADVILVVLALLIPPKKFPSVRIRWLFLACCGGLAALVAGGWGVANAGNLKLYEEARLRLGISPVGNWEFVEQHPLLFGAAVLRTSRFHAFDYLDEFVSTIGWLAASIPRWVVGVYAALMITAAATQTVRTVLEAWQKAVLLAAFLAGTVAVFVMLWGFETPATYIQRDVLRGVGHVPGVQGRYFVPFALPLCLLLSNRRLRLNPRWFVGFAVAVICLGSGAAWMTIRQTFYETGAAAAASLPVGKLEGSLARKPGDSSEEQKVYFVEHGRKRWVTTADWIVSKGMKWPSGVGTIEARELDALPLGATLP